MFAQPTLSSQNTVHFHCDIYHHILLPSRTPRPCVCFFCFRFFPLLWLQKDTPPAARCFRGCSLTLVPRGASQSADMSLDATWSQPIGGTVPGCHASRRQSQRARMSTNHHVSRPVAPSPVPDPIRQNGFNKQSSLQCQEIILWHYCP